MDPELEDLIERALAAELLAEFGGGQTPQPPPGRTAAQGQTPSGTPLVPSMQSQGVGQVPTGIGTPAAPQRSMLYEIGDHLLGFDDGVTTRGEDIGSWLNAGGESMTLGLVGDEADAALRAALTGGDYDQILRREREIEADFRERNPWGSLSADVVGGVIPGFLGVGAMAQAPNALRAVVTGGALGAGAGATHGFMEGEGRENRLAGAGLGAGLGGVVGLTIPAVTHGLRNALAGFAENRLVREAARNAPSSDDLRRIGSELYRQIDDAGVQIRPDVYQRAVGEIRDQMMDEGVRFTGSGTVLPSSTAVANALAEVGQGANTIPWREADMLRRYMGHAAGANIGNPGDTRVATQALTRFDDMVRNLGLEDVDAGDLEALQTALPQAREVWSRMMRSQTIDDAIENAGNYVSGETSGLVNQFSRILRNPQLRRSFSEIEQRAMRRVVNGTIPEQALNMIGGRIGQYATMGVGTGLGGLPGFLAGAATAGVARRASDGMRRNSAELVRGLIANGGIAQAPPINALAGAVLNTGDALAIGYGSQAFPERWRTPAPQ